MARTQFDTSVFGLFGSCLKRWKVPVFGSKRFRPPSPGFDSQGLPVPAHITPCRSWYSALTLLSLMLSGFEGSCS